jgi:hypothetical protein
MAITLAVAGLVVSCGAFVVAAASAWFSRRQLQLSERQRERDFEAAVVAELVSFNRSAETLDYKLLVTNAGPAVLPHLPTLRPPGRGPPRSEQQTDDRSCEQQLKTRRNAAGVRA